jgi:CubicO group peptidase (beta-lactamase class C family)
LRKVEELTQSSITEPTVHGWVAPGFEPVRDAFGENFRSKGDTGAAFAAYRSGRQIVHLWGGEREAGAPWAEDTLVCGFSTGKGITTLAIQILVDRGQLDVDAPVSTVWKEFDTHGKARMTTRMLLNHTAGLPTFPEYERVVNTDDPASFQRHDAIAAALAATTPLWEPGTQSGYHSITMGYLLGEIVRRITGKTIGQFIRSEIAQPLGLDYWVGLPEAEHPRVARLQADLAFGSDDTFTTMNHTTPGGQALFMGPVRGLDAVFGETFNDPAFRQAEVAAAGPHTDAHSLARIYGALASDGSIDGVRLVSPATISTFAQESFSGIDVIANLHSRLGLGYALNSSLRYPMGPNPEAFGHPGYGGAMAFADPISGVGIGYVTKAMVIGMGTDHRVQALTEALYGCM